jgi:ankyrin repeat protein
MAYANIEVQDVADLIKQGPITILDSRDMNSFNESHMESAVPANDIIIEKLIRNKLKAQNILVYCYRGNSSRDLCSLLGKMGFKSVYNLVGGYTEWKKFQNQKNASNYLYPLSSWMAEKGFNPSNLNDRIDNANTPLMEAALEGNVEMTDALLKKGADVNAVNDDENNALWFACVANNVEIITLLVTAGVNINHKNVNGASCLIYSASAGKFESVKQLVESGIDPFLTTLDGFHALDSASTLPILKYLKPLFHKQAENA